MRVSHKNVNVRRVLITGYVKDTFAELWEKSPAQFVRQNFEVWKRCSFLIPAVLIGTALVSLESTCTGKQRQELFHRQKPFHKRKDRRVTDSRWCKWTASVRKIAGCNFPEAFLTVCDLPCCYCLGNPPKQPANYYPFDLRIIHSSKWRETSRNAEEKKTKNCKNHWWEKLFSDETAFSGVGAHMYAWATENPSFHERKTSKTALLL